jgi:hypothetical protein
MTRKAGKKKRRKKAAEIRAVAFLRFRKEKKPESEMQGDRMMYRKCS